MDPLTLITLAKSVSTYLPAITSWFDDDNADKNANLILEVAHKVTAESDPVNSIQALHNSDVLREDFLRAINPIVIAKLENNTRRLAETNATMRAELNTASKFKSYWRPAFGWALLLTWTITMLSFIFVLAYVVISTPANMANVLSGIAQVMGPFSVMWGIALSVLGINISKRSQDKAITAGIKPPPGLLGAVAQRLGGKSG